MVGHEHIKKAYEAILAHDFELALSQFARAIELEPNNAAYHYKISITYARSNKLQQAIQHAEKACLLNEDDKEYRQHLQYLQARKLIYKAEKFFTHSKDHLNEAIALLDEALTLDSLAIDAFLLKGLAHAELNEYNKALAAMQDVLKLDPQHDIAQKLEKQYKDNIPSSN